MWDVGTSSTFYIFEIFCNNIKQDLSSPTVSYFYVLMSRCFPPDVFPLHQDWTVEDCVRFTELCVEQQFVGVCKDVGRDPLSAGEPLLTLDLIDTSTDEDVYLNKQLVAEGRARLGSAALT